MIKHLLVDKIQRNFVRKVEINLLIFKTLLFYPNTVHLNDEIMKYLLKDINAYLNGFTTRSRINSVCVLTGRTRAVYRKTFKITRMQIKEKASFGLIPGIRKSS